MVEDYSWNDWMGDHNEFLTDYFTWICNDLNNRGLSVLDKAICSDFVVWVKSMTHYPIAPIIEQEEEYDDEEEEEEYDDEEDEKGEEEEP